MASIQQSMNALVNSVFGASAIGTHFIKESSTYKAKQEAKALEEKAERLQDYTEGIDVADQGEAYAQSRDLQIEAGMIDPKGKVPSHDVPGKKVTRAERARELIKEIDEEKRFEREQAQKAQKAQEDLEIEKARETVRRTILGQDNLSAKIGQTANFQQALEKIREKEGTLI